MAVRGLWVAALMAMGVWSSSAIAGGGIQTSATHVRPKPSRANADRGQAYKDGCHVEKAATGGSSPSTG